MPLNLSSLLYHEKPLDIVTILRKNEHIFINPFINFWFTSQIFFQSILEIKNKLSIDATF